MIRFSILFFLLSGCSTNHFLGTKKYLEKNEGFNWIYSKSKSYPSTKFYIVSPTKLKTARSYYTLTYLGTDSLYSYFRTWNKLLKPNEIMFFAILNSSCEIKKTRSVDEEVNYKKEGYNYHQWRRAKVKNGKCVVDEH